MRWSTLVLLVGLSGGVAVHAQCDPATVFANTTTNAVCISVSGPVRTVYANALPDHETGTFPNAGNPNSIRAQRITLTMCAEPRIAPTKTYLDKGSGACPFWVFGVATNGLEFDPIANEFFRNPSTGQLNRDWNLNALSPNVRLGLDMNQAHVQPNGKYHYHGDPSRFIEKLGISSTAHSPIIGYAADGFPIYYRYVYADPSSGTSRVVDLTSGYALRTGTRPGDGISAPNGAYDGTYTQDYVYTPTGAGGLDECNGRFGSTPEYPAGVYHYVMTGTYPVIPRCLSGHPDKAFTIGPPPQGCATSNASEICSSTSVENDPDLLLTVLRVSPSPARDVLHVSFRDDHVRTHINGIHVYDVAGRRMMSLSGSPGVVDISSLSPGTYYLRAVINDAEITVAFVKE